MGNWAFFSYARADSAAAEKLHAALDRYRAPGDLVGRDGANGPVPRTFHPVFRDVSDLSGGGHLNDKIQLALADSTCLVVLCSPAAAQSPWVNRECQTFIDQGKAARIFPVITPNLAAAGDRDELFEETFFPLALRGKGFLAADLRETTTVTGKPVGDGEDNGRLKLIAGLLGVPLDSLIQREARRQRRLVAMLGAAALVFAGVAAAAVWQTFAANSERARAMAGETLAEQNALEADRERDAAIAARAEAEQNAREREEQRALAETQRQLADRNAEQARIQELAAKANAADANAQRDQARGALARIFVERSWDAMGRGDYPLAARYALAGIVSAPALSDEYRNALASLSFNAEDSAVHHVETAGLTFAAYNPSGDRLVTGSSDGFARIWVTESRELQTTLRGHSDSVTSAEFSPNGNLVVTASDDRTVRVWDASNGTLNSILAGHSAAVKGARFNPAGDRIVTASADGTVLTWKFEEHQDTWTIEKTLGVAVERDGFAEQFLGIFDSPCFSPDGSLVLAASWDGDAYIWDVTSGEVVAVLGGHRDGVSSATFDNAGDRIVTTSRGGTVRLWSRSGPADWTESYRIEQSADWIVSGRFSPDGRRIVTSSFDGTARVYDADSGREIAVMRGHAGPVLSASYSADGATILTASSDGSAREWSDPRRNQARAWRLDGERVLNVLITGPSALVATQVTGGARIWNTAAGNQVSFLQVPDVPISNGGLSATISPDGRLVVTSVRYGEARVRDLVTGRSLYLLRGNVWDAAFSSDSQRLAVTDRRSTRVLDAQTGREIVELQGHEDDVWSGRFSFAGQLIVTASDDGTARLWNTETGAQIRVFGGHIGGLSSAEFSPDARHIIVAARDGTGRIWDVESGAATAILRGHQGALTGAHYSLDGSRLVTSASDRTARIWSVDGRELAVLRSEEDVLDATLTSDGRLITRSASGTLEVIDARPLIASLRDLRSSACQHFLLPRREARSFSDLEFAADPLIREVWLRNAAGPRSDVCEGVSGAPPLLTE